MSADDRLKQLSQKSDHELLIIATNDIAHVKEDLAKVVQGETANCAAEKTRVACAEQQIEKLWKTRASAISLNLLWSISVTLYGSLILYLVTHR
ncbi:hypothetical protein LLG46_02425 [bacterium]|nr:hypothetical protein [bacterium]